jgi:hypothetical protein
MQCIDKKIGTYLEVVGGGLQLAYDMVWNCIGNKNTVTWVNEDVMNKVIHL